eukprot:TRINITY_DN50695_c0_g2_i1.p2 TRINITY_DN50695_c0_g2~~TRINITY_DN50695_c0_g2_i1.p2  ORF type:complete len:231 (+),score=37.52 TRINITY_DN50695_c0_g2_i1:135-827(+)
MCIRDRYQRRVHGLRRSVYKRAESLIASRTMAGLMENITNHVRKIVNCERVNVLFYDSKRDELYKRVRMDKGEAILPCKETKGISATCVQTLTAIMTNNVKSEYRFYKKTDDPEGIEASKILAVPFISSEDKFVKEEFLFPRGVAVAINKKGEKEFTPDDIENLTQYCALAAKVFDLVTRLEYFLSMGGQVHSMRQQTAQLLHSCDGTGTCMQLIENQFSGIRGLLDKMK